MIFQRVTTKIAKYGLIIHALLYYAWVAILFGADFTHGAEDFVLWGIWVVATGLLLVFSTMNLQRVAKKVTIWIYGTASLVLVTQALFWSYFFFHMRAIETIEVSFWTMFFYLIIFGLPTISCVWLAFTMACATFRSTKSH